MKKFLGYLALILLLVSTLFVSCPNGPDVPLANVNLKVSNSVSRDAGSNEGYLDLNSLTLQYKSYPLNEWSVPPRGTVTEWKTVKDYSDGKFSIGSVMPTQWVVETRFLNEAGVVVYYGKTKIDVVKDQTFELVLDDVRPVIEDLTGQIVIKVKAKEDIYSQIMGELNSGVERVQSSLSFRYRYNNTQDSSLKNNTAGETYQLIYDSKGDFSNESVDIKDLSGSKVGSISYERDGNGDIKTPVTYVIKLDNMPYGYYFYYLDFLFYQEESNGSSVTYSLDSYYSTNFAKAESAYIYLDKEVVEDELEFSSESRYSASEYRPVNVENRAVYTYQGTLMDALVGAAPSREAVVPPADTYHVTPTVGVEYSMNTSLGPSVHAIKLHADYVSSDVDFEWTYNDAESGRIVTLTGQEVVIDFAEGLSNPRRIIDYNGKPITLTVKDRATGDTKYSNNIIIKAGHDIYFETDEAFNDFINVDGDIERTNILKIKNAIVDGKFLSMPDEDVELENYAGDERFPYIISSFLKNCFY